MKPLSDIGLVGLAVMGENLVLNMESKGFTVGVFNRSVDKVKFLEQCGFEQVVLARELSLQQIREIGEKTSVPLECFVHG